MWGGEEARFVKICCAVVFEDDRGENVPLCIL